MPAAGRWEQNWWVGVSLGTPPRAMAGTEPALSGPVEVTLIYLFSGHPREASMQEGCQGESRGLGGYVGSGFQVERPG